MLGNISNKSSSFYPLRLLEVASEGTGLVTASARRTTIIPPNNPSKLAYFSLGRAPVLVSLRPSSEHILIVRAPGAQDHTGAPPSSLPKPLSDKK